MRKNILFLCFLLSSCGAVTQEELNAKLAQINRRIEKLEEEQKTIRAQQIRTEERVDALSQNLASLRLEMERLRVEGRTSSPQYTPSKPESAPKSQPAKVEGQPRTQPQEGQRGVEATSSDYEKEYKSALDLYNLRQLNQAKEKFIEFIRKNPKTPLTDNAYLWLGIIYRDLGDNARAEAVWRTLEERCKRGEMVDCNKLPSVYLQLARLYEAQGNNEKAKEYYEAILREFPLSEEAEIAKKKLGR
ncbi:tetratricopeptide repeat protein [Thermocrinis sp.]|jgi:TolA-binding protein|uniref:tetratricopeptide repeat protein n=1 Tax=Thermocrinis sp. TaxID=2024383 RepID=UPI00260E53AE|nr:tetratricopeptide repeat protein [Thermocrinis sp.]